MPVKNAKELFVTILSQVRQGTERSGAIYSELSELAQNDDVREALAARALVSQQDVAKIDEAFKLIGEKPVSLTGRLNEAFVEDFRKDLAEVQFQEARRLLVLAKAIYLSQMRTAELTTLVSAADLSGHYGVGVLLESCLASHLAFVERTKRLIRGIAEVKIAARASG